MKRESYRWVKQQNWQGNLHEILADYNVPLINYSPEELDEDITNAQRHSSWHQLFNTSNKIGYIELLKKLFGKLAITQTVADEFNKPLPDG